MSRVDDHFADAREVEYRQLDDIEARLGHLHEVRALTARLRQLMVAGERVVSFAGVWRPPGRLAVLIDDLGDTLADSTFRAPSVEPDRWSDDEWRRRAHALDVPYSVLLQKAAQLAAAAGVDRIRDLDHVPASIVGDLVDELERLAERSARIYARKDHTS